MKAKAAIVQGVLALAGLGAAYATWQRPPDLGPGDVNVLSVSRHELEKVRFDSPDRTLVLTRGDLNGDSVVWVDEDEHPVRKPAPPGRPPLAADTWHRTLVGNDVADKVLDQLVSLKATRALGKLDDAKLKELALTGATSHLEVDAGGAKFRFAISTQPAGVEMPYLRRESDGQVFLLGGMLVADLSGPRRLVDRRLHDFPPDAFDTVALAIEGQKRTYAAKTEGGAYLPQLSDQADAKPDSQAKTWHDQLWRSVAVDLLGRGEAPPGGEPVPVFRVDYARRGHSVGWVEIAKAGDAFYARSEHTAGWAKLGGPVEDLVRQTRQLVGK